MSAAGNYSFPWMPDQGDGTYRNPILYADYSDPDVVRVGDDFYLVASSFNCTPGLPILHSKDLVNWTLINHALKNLPDLRYADVQAGCGVWAPAIRFHAGKYWILFPTPDEGIYVTTASHPGDEWSAPQLVQAGRGLIDPCPFWDDDGRAYVFYSSEGNWTMYVVRLDADFTGPELPQVENENWSRVLVRQMREGPAPFKFAGKYYLITSACTGWKPNAADVAVAETVLGPYVQKGNPCVGEEAEITYETQSTAVLPLAGQPGRFIFMADEWHPQNLADSRQVWLPINMATNGTFKLAWHDRWELGGFGAKK